MPTRHEINALVTRVLAWPDLAKFEVLDALSRDLGVRLDQGSQEQRRAFQRRKHWRQCSLLPSTWSWRRTSADRFAVRSSSGRAGLSLEQREGDPGLGALASSGGSLHRPAQRCFLTRAATSMLLKIVGCGTWKSLYSV